MAAIEANIKPVSVARNVTERKNQYREFCRLRDYRKPGAEVPQYTEAEAFALATSKSKACSPATTKAQPNE
ncbi:hypothetical protein [Janthinobacterium sp. BJB401]|uniref:hypothetical protein n=1 Tax=Janthinobacterium sp. BJB401 TaxID=2745934 RepID=UPI0015952508|nr:hypothetical protein [Janthinobacterium sp. BJB401]NVI81905.1 hypothetical protein [Janthinobacterium sp. BJB401]